MVEVSRVKVALLGLLLLIGAVILCSLYWIESQKHTYTLRIPGPPVRVHSGVTEPTLTRSNSSSSESTESPTESIASPAANKSWKSDSFCDKFIDHTLSTRQPLCNGGKTFPGDPTECYVSPYSNLMATCVINNMAVQPLKLHKAWKQGSGQLNSDEMAMQLLKSEGHCGPPVSPNLMNKIENGDWIKKTLQGLVSNEPVSSASCKLWVNETAYFFASPSVHIYFRFLAWYNLHKAITRDTPHEYPPMIVQLTDPIKAMYLFADYEKILFPNMYLLTEFPNITVCFKRSVFVPREFASVLFRCKMESNIRSQCFGCNGRGLTDTSLYTFRQRVIQACSLTDDKVKGSRNDSDPVRIVVILRKPYTRWKGADPNKVERRLVNEQELLSGLKSAFPVTNLFPVHMETLPICEQIRLVHEADVLVGVHGAGLVHLWWLQEDGILIELIPSYELGNPTFQMLSTLAGRRYQSINIGPGRQEVRANVPEVVKALQQAL